MSSKNNNKNYLNLKNLPNNILIEQGILTILLTNPDLIKNVIDKLKINTFYSESNKIIYQHLLELIESNKSPNITNLISILQNKGLLQQIGGIDMITFLIKKSENSLDLENYIEELNEKYIRRLLIDLGKQIIVWGYTTSENLEKIIEKIENFLFTLNQDNLSKKIYTSAEIIDEVFSEIKTKIKKNETSGLETSFKDFDSILQGFQKSDLIIIAGRPSMGKTAFALNLAKNIIVKHNVPFIIFSLEMSRQQIIYRFLATEANISSNRLKSGKMNQLEWENLSFAMKKIAELPIYIDDNPNLTMVDIRSKLKKISILNKNFVIIIDYLQLMKVNLKLENRVQEISYITRNLKILAKEFQIPILLLSQLSRNVESRINKRPMLSDLRESGCLGKLDPVFFEVLDIWNKKNIIRIKKKKNYTFKGIKPVFKILLKNSCEIILTANHKVLTYEGWIRVSEINKNTKIYYQVNSLNFSGNLVDSIRYLGLKPVYDCTIPFFHNYLAEKIIIHNSIEQDADIVIMIYRDEYYNDSKGEPNITEFIIAKHRNGPIGTAKLLFNSNTTTFSNIK